MAAMQLCSVPALAASVVLLAACASPAPRDDSAWLPRIAAAPAIVAATPVDELGRLKLVATNLVSILVQLPELRPANTTLQVSEPVSAFGNSLIRAMEDAGYGVQQVSADQGRHYTSYSRRYAETEAGTVNDYEVSINAIQVRREFSESADGIFPSSLAIIEGSEAIASVVVDDALFREQGGVSTTFLSGARATDGSLAGTGIGEVEVRAEDALPDGQRTEAGEVLSDARQRFLTMAGEARVRELTDHERMRRTVLIFDNARTLTMGAGNKQAVRLLARDVRRDDVFEITACTDADGRNATANARGARVAEELLSHGIDESAIYLAPCRRASYRHPSDDSPVPVEIVQHRARRT